MNSIYQLKTGEAIDLSEIVQIGNLRKIGTKRPHEFEIILKSATCKIVVNAYSIGDEIREAYQEACLRTTPMSGDSPQERAEIAASEVYKDFCYEVRDDLINAWRKYKEEA